MATWTLDSAESIDVESTSTSSVNVDKVIVSQLRIDFGGKRLILHMDKGVDDGGFQKKDDAMLHIRDDDAFDSLLATLTNDGETLLAAIERILMSKANTDGVIPAGTIS
jgi:hypothetical protein